MGLKHIDTPYVFLTDIDFVPCFGLYRIIRTNIATIKLKEPKALIVPAFETVSYRSTIPKTKVELLQHLEKKNIFTFRHDVWAPGHAPTNYEKWKTASLPYQVETYNIIPYVNIIIIYTSNTKIIINNNITSMPVDL